MIKFFSALVALLIATPVALSANDILVDGIITQKIHRNTPQKMTFRMSSDKSVSILKLKFSENAKQALQHHMNNSINTIETSSKLAHSIQLGMNKVPVLDQGLHGSCATFAVVGAIDALSGKGDYYSQLCLLNLGNYLNQYGYGESGWNGQMPRTILTRIEEFGLISKDTQKSVGCGGVTEYPLIGDDSSDSMSLIDYHQYSEPSYYSNFELWTQILDISKFISHDVDMNDILEQTKNTLYHGNRVVLGVLLPLNATVGLSGQYHYPNDTWILTAELEQAAKFFIFDFTNWGGHAMIITGYDDNAVVTDTNGNEHKGLLTLRNSWGSDVGDHGDFYMTYDYFKTLGMDLIDLKKVTP